MLINLKDFAQQKGWNIDNLNATGEEQGYLITIVEGQSFKTFIISLVGISESQKNRVLTFLNEQKKNVAISDISFEDHVLYFKIKEYQQQLTASDISHLVSLVTQYLRENNICVTNYCVYCHKSNTNDQVFINGIGYYSHKECYEKTTKERKKEVVEYNFLHKNYIRGTIGALVGALPGALLWIFVSYYGWFVAFVGYLIAKGALRGYLFLGGRIGKLTRWMILIIVFITVALAEFADFPIYLIMNQYDVSMENLILLLTENVGSYIINLAIGLLFAFFGISSLFRDLRDY